MAELSLRAEQEDGLVRYAWIVVELTALTEAGGRRLKDRSVVWNDVLHERGDEALRPGPAGHVDGSVGP